MDSIELIGMIGDIATIIALFAGGWLAVFVYRQFAPVLDLRISTTWPNTDKRWVIIRLEVENVSRIRIKKESIFFQLLEHEVPNGSALSEWVPFKESAIIPEEKPITWREPIEIFTSTKTISPGEILVVERLHYSQLNNVLHAGIQVTAKLGFIERLSTKIRGWGHRWTTTRIIMK